MRHLKLSATYRRVFYLIDLCDEFNWWAFGLLFVWSVVELHLNMVGNQFGHSRKLVFAKEVVQMMDLFGVGAEDGIRSNDGIEGIFVT